MLSIRKVAENVARSRTILGMPAQKARQQSFLVRYFSRRAHAQDRW